MNRELLGDEEEDYKGESAYRKKCKYARDFYEQVFCKFFSDDAYLKEIQLQKDELYKIKKQVSDQKREYNKLLTIDGRADNLTEKLIEAANRLNIELPLTNSSDIKLTGNGEGIVFLSDWHYGQVSNNIFNTYNTKICKDRVCRLAAKVNQYIKLNQISKLHIVLLGDEIDGGIHTSSRVSQEEATVDQLMQVSEIIAQFIDNISGEVNETLIYSTYGNHARSIQNKNDSVHSDNLERLIPWWLEQRLKVIDKNIRVVYSDYKELIKISLCGVNVVCVHGDLEKFSQLGVTMNTIFSRLYGETIDYCVMGDKHHLEEKESLGIESIIIRSLCGTDGYAGDKRLYSNPGQTFMVFTEEDGRQATYNIRLN